MATLKSLIWMRLTKPPKISRGEIVIKSIKSLICSASGHKIVNTTMINSHVFRFQCSRCGGDLAINFMVQGGILDWDDVKELYKAPEGAKE